jgi:hypothetical protein
MAASDGATLTTLSNILKEYYLGPVTEQLNNEVLLLSRLESRSEDLVGKYAYVPLHKTRSGGVGARAEQGALPVAGKQGYDKAKYDLKYLYGAVQVTGPSVAKTKNEAGSFLQVLKSELDGLRNDLRKDLARQIYGDGTARIAQCGTTTSANIVVLATTGAYKGKDAIRKGQLYVGMLVDIGTAADVNAISGATPRQITAVDYDNGTITIDGAAVTTSSSHYVTRAGSAVDGGATAAGSRSSEIDGIARIIDADAPTSGSNTFGELDPYTEQWWDNQRLDLSTKATNAGVLEQDDLQKALNLVRLQGTMPTAMITSLGVQRDVYGLLVDQVQYIEPQSLTYAAGFKTLTYNGMPIIADIDAPYGHLYILDESTMKVFSDQDWHFLDMDGSTLRQVPGYDVFEAVMARYMNLGVTRRNNQMVIKGINVDGAADTGV